MGSIIGWFVAGIAVGLIAKQILPAKNIPQPLTVAGSSQSS
jgi:hypothetical protein